jgi:hypothetical protein
LLVATGRLREAGVPARLRVGYAGYFIPGKWEVHCICEYQRAGLWIQLDGQLGPIARNGFRIGFPGENMALTAWRSAPSIWRRTRLHACGLIAKKRRCGSLA